MVAAVPYRVQTLLMVASYHAQTWQIIDKSWHDKNKLKHGTRNHARAKVRRFASTKFDVLKVT